MLGVLCLSIALVGCQNKTEALTSSVTIKDKASFKPMNETIDYKEDYVYEYLGLKFSLSQNIKEAMNNKSLVMLDSQSALNEKLRYAFLSFNKVSRKQQDAVVQNMNEYMKWEKNLERSGTIGMYKKGMSEKEITELTQCTYHKKIGISHDGQYSYYISYQNDAFKRELEQCHIEIIDRLEENDNGFVLKEKNDLENTEVFYKIDKCVSVLKKMLEEAVAARNADIHIIKAQTALGKTEQYAEIVKNWIGKKFIIAVPTIKLQREVAERIEAKGVECEITESMYTKIAQLGLPDLEEKLNKDFSKGFTKRGKKTILEYKKEHMDELSPRQLEIFNEILKKRKIGYSGARCIVTTHALFLMKELYKMQDYEIIIDEDLLMTLFHFTSSLPLSDIEKLLELPFIDADNREQLERILELDNEETLQVNFTSLSESVLEKLYEQRNEFTGPVPKLFDSTHVIMCKNKKEIVFIKKYDFGDCSKMTILSATADRALYEDYFSGKTINFREVYKAEYKGKVLQYTAHTLSRAFFNKNGGTDVLEEIKEKYIGDIPIITFKMLAPDSESHFGKTAGFNVYRGMDIAVIGTPHNSPVLYELVGAMLGYDTSGSLHRYRVERGGYSFPMMSYDDGKMRNMQLFFIESELEQAVGRARLLRENCTVYVFSNYPCQQAEIIENPYLRVKTEEDTEKNEDEIIQNETMEY